MGTRLFTGLYAGRESLITNGAALATTSDNIANSNTVGFKESRIEFANLLAEGQGGLYNPDTAAGNGPMIAGSKVAHSSQGAIDPTARQLDFAIQGQGYFILNDASSSAYYTRAGNFSSDADGNIISNNGENLMGFTEASPDTLVALNTSDISGQASATSTISITGNLNASDEIQGDPDTAPATFAALSAASDFSTSVEVVDSLGEKRDVIVHFFHTGIDAGGQTWVAQAYVDAAEVGGVEGTPQFLNQVQMAMTTDGVQAEGAETLLEVTPAWGNGAAAGAFSFDLSNFSAFSTQSSVSAVSVDGTVPGNVTGFSLGADGTVGATLDSGETAVIGTLALAKFVNPDGLEKVGSNRFAQGADTGELTVAAAGSDGLGETRNGALESSSVDLSKEFVNVVRYQRGYQAGSKVITTMDEIINQTLNLV